MISADFYPDYYTYNSGNIITDTTNNIPVTTEDFSNMYYLGWIRPENLPQMFKMAECSQQITSDDVIYRWDTITPTDTNYNCGYLVKTPNGYANIQNYAILSRNISTGIWQHGGATDRNNNWAFPNKLDVMKEGAGLTKLAILACRFNSDDTYQDRWIWTGGGTLGYQSFDFNAMIEFLYGDGSLQITSGTYTLTFKKSDFDEDGTLYKNFDNSEYKCKLFICGYDFSFARDSNSYPTCCPSFFTSFTDINGKKWVTTGNLINYNQYWAEGSGMVTTWHGGYVGTLRRSELQSMISPFYASETGKPFAYNGTVLAIRTDNNATYWYSCIYPPDAIAKHYALIIRASTVDSNGVPLYGYTENSVYAPYVTEDNEFTATLITGDLSDDEFKAKLRPWQYDIDEWSENEYTEDDLPPYEPEPSGEDEESGTRIPNQFRYFTGANNFISMYAMKASQIQTFGQMLWNSWADGNTFVDAVNNFWISLNIENFTGSFDISSVMSFIVSLKVFPFNITHFDTTANPIIDTTNTLRIGRGTFPFLFPSEVGNFYKVLSNIVYVDCGLIHDPTTGQYGIPRKFNDFRDYTNVSITCFCPYCGTVELNPGDVVGRQLSCKYAIDLQTGECLCLITVADSTGDLYNVAAISGNIGANIPVSATNSGLIESKRLSEAGNALGLFGGMFTENLSMGSNTFAKAKDSQSSIGAIASASTQAASNLFKDIKQTSNFAANMLSRGAIGCPMMQGGSGFAAFSQADTPYVQIRYGIYSEPANYSHSIGRISTKSDVLSSYKDSGLVICENVDVSGFTCHEDERSEIKALLESGVYL